MGFKCFGYQQCLISSVAEQWTNKLEVATSNRTSVNNFTVRDSSCGQVMFLHLSVILFTGGCGRGACVAGCCAFQREGMHGRGMHGRGCAWQKRWPLQQTVCILLECILVLLIFLLSLRKAFEANVANFVQFTKKTKSLFSPFHV